MAHPSIPLIDALRYSADRLDDDAGYACSHQGRCNCGHLVQTLSGYSAARIHELALEKPGNWAEKSREYCPDSGYSIDDILALLFASGLSATDIHHLEHLSDPAVLHYIPAILLPLDHRRRDDVITYFHTWADLLEAKLAGHKRAPLHAASLPLPQSSLEER